MGVKQLGTAIRTAREAIIVDGKPLSQLAVAAETGVSQSTVAKYEAGEVGVPNPAVLRKMANLLNADLLEWYSIWLDVRWPGGARATATAEDAERLFAEIQSVLSRFRRGDTEEADGRRTGNE
jgi:transcriptional regulator with XRE-family HTH domain